MSIQTHMGASPAPSLYKRDNRTTHVCIYIHTYIYINIYTGSGCRKCQSMMIIAFITMKSSLVPLIESLCAQIYFRFEISEVLLT